MRKPRKPLTTAVPTQAPTYNAPEMQRQRDDADKPLTAWEKRLREPGYGKETTGSGKPWSTETALREFRDHAEQGKHNISYPEHRKPKTDEQG